MPFYATDDFRRLVSEARRQALEREGRSISSADVSPAAAIPGQSPPRLVSYWEAGKLYQPGDLVQSNNYGDIAQTAITNFSFESGDQDWTYSDDFAIVNTAGFKGSWRAEFTGQSLGFFLWSGNNIVQRTDDIATISNYAPGGSDKIMASSGSLVVIVPAGLSSATAYYTSDGENYTAASTVPWSGAGTFERAFYESANGLFYVVRETGNANYYTTSDGVTWTTRAWGATLDCHYIFGRGGNTYAIILNGSQYDLYSSASGTGSWSLVDSDIGVPINAQFVDNGTTIVAVGYNAGDYEVWESSADGETWAENTTGTTNLTAALATNAAFELAYGDGTYVVARTGTNAAPTTDYTAYSTDLTSWTAVNSFQSIGLGYAEALGSFIALTSANRFVHSTDGITWTTTGTGASMEVYDGFKPVAISLTPVLATMVNDDRASTFAGQIVSATAKVQTGAETNCYVGIRFFDGGGTVLKTVYGNPLEGDSSNWREIEVSALAPLDTATCTPVLAATGTGDAEFDYVEWDHFTQSFACEFIYESTQADAGYSDEAEPVWPTVSGNTVVDNEVTWTARPANCVVWEAKPVLLSGTTEPTWPTEEGATVEDNTILWTADSGRVKDVNCPNTKTVAIVASKVFAGDDDIVAFSATGNPLDWSSANDAGFIPFGLNTYGSEAVSALGIYRSNLVVWNSQAFQMWQVDPDPQNFAILDAIPVGNRFYKSGSPVSNDLVWLTDEGIRNIGIAGAANNLQAGYFGKQIDPLIQAAIAAIGDEDDIISLYYPGQGQYWLIFEDTAYVLTMNGGKSDMSWSRYVFPSSIDDYTIKDGDLYLRSGTKVWLFDEDAVQDDVGGTPSNFEGRVWWHYLDFGALGITKSMIGFDVVASGTFNVAVGYDQSNTATATTDYELTGDTLPNGVIPLPVTSPSFQFRLTWDGGEAWEWYASALYLQDWRITS